MNASEQRELPDSQPVVESEYRGGKWTAPRPFISLLSEAASQAGIELRWLSDDWIAHLRKADDVRYVYGTAFPLNNAGAAHIAADKVATYVVLDDAGVPAVPHYLIRVASSDEPDETIDRALAKVHCPVVVKPAEEAGGLDVHRAETIEEARSLIDRLARCYSALAVSPFETILSEHRVIMLDGIPQLFYEKRILSKTEWRHNLKYGAHPVVEESPDVRAELANIAIAAMRTIGGRFMSVDVVRTPNSRKVLEVNSGVMLDRFAAQNRNYRAIAVHIYREAISRCFENSD
jgi:glutathione synthase/RimK-type ligase-like ATP-grasp enzyme